MKWKDLFEVRLRVCVWFKGVFFVCFILVLSGMYVWVWGCIMYIYFFNIHGSVIKIYESERYTKARKGKTGRQDLISVTS